MGEMPTTYNALQRVTGDDPGAKAAVAARLDPCRSFAVALKGARLAMNDPHRPRYHFSPDNWMNDPIPFYWQGASHIFFQHNPAGAYHADMHWGHAISHDLVRWEQLPIALAPTSSGPDQEGVWTGCVVEDGGTFYAFYTGIPHPRPPLDQVQCVAVSDDLTTWRKPAANPVIGAPPPGFGECFRDPCVWRQEGTWHMMIGSELPERQGGAALHYTSPDLHDWRYEGVLSTSTTAETGHDYECPDLFPLGDRFVLLTSRGRTHWQTGPFDGQHFTREHLGSVDGPTYYAAKTLLDDQNRRILFGWLREARPVEVQKDAGWSGVLSLPRVLSLLPDGTLGQVPAPELSALRGAHRRVEPFQLAASEGQAEATAALPGVSGATLELALRIRPEAGAVAVRVRTTPDGAECAEIRFDPQTGQLGEVALHLAPGEPLDLRVFVDHSVVEAFANGRACFTVRTYPTRDDARGVTVATTGRCTVEDAKVWEVGL